MFFKFYRCLVVERCRGLYDQTRVSRYSISNLLKGEYLGFDIREFAYGSCSYCSCVPGLRSTYACSPHGEVVVVAVVVQ